MAKKPSTHKAKGAGDAARASSKEETFEYHFGGPPGALAIVVFLPLVVLLLAHFSHVGRIDLTILDGFIEASKQKDGSYLDAFISSPVFCPGCASPSRLPYAIAGLIAWFVFQVFLERFLPCELIQGPPVKGDPKNRLTYRINGHLAFWVTLLVVQVGWPSYHQASGTWQLGSIPLDEVLYENYAVLALASNILCMALSIYLYSSSFVPVFDDATKKKKSKILANGGVSGNIIYDFFIGRELNPRSLNGTFDWKEFCELRPGLIFWMLLNFSCLQAQKNHLGYVTGSMMMVNVFQGIYVWDALYQERAILTTMDITTDGFGFMLIFGDMAWVPFIYSAQARYLVHNDPNLSVASLVVILLLHILGYIIFRGANGQKDAFRRDPNDPSVAHLQYLQTARGTKLLTSGWWGMARKINYTGDYLMSLTWCLLCGFGSIVPYFYAIYFLVLLITRSIRDDAMCHEKYGDDWLEYKQRVPYRFIPGVI